MQNSLCTLLMCIMQSLTTFCEFCLMWSHWGLRQLCRDAIHCWACGENGPPKWTYRRVNSRHLWKQESVRSSCFFSSVLHLTSVGSIRSSVTSCVRDSAWQACRICQESFLWRPDLLWDFWDLLCWGRWDRLRWTKMLLYFGSWHRRKPTTNTGLTVLYHPRMLQLDTQAGGFLFGGSVFGRVLGTRLSCDR